MYRYICIYTLVQCTCIYVCMTCIYTCMYKLPEHVLKHICMYIYIHVHECVYNSHTSFSSWSRMMTVQCSQGISSCAAFIIWVIMASRLAVSSNRPRAISSRIYIHIAKTYMYMYIIIVSVPASVDIYMYTLRWVRYLESTRESECSIQKLSIEQANSAECHKHVKFLYAGNICCINMELPFLKSQPHSRLHKCTCILL